MKKQQGVKGERLPMTKDELMSRLETWSGMVRAGAENIAHDEVEKAVEAIREASKLAIESEVDKRIRAVVREEIVSVLQTANVIRDLWPPQALVFPSLSGMGTSNTGGSPK